MKSTSTKLTTFSSLRTLIVDDNSTNLRILERTLRHHFSHLVNCNSLKKANNGDEALDAIRNDHFDLLLLDIDMPTISGVEVAQAIRQSNDDMIIIACTTSDSPAARHLYSQVGMDGCVSKPLNLREVDEALLHALQSRMHLNLFTESLPITRASSKFHTHHGSLPTIDLNSSQISSDLPILLSDSGLQDMLVLNSHYFQDLTMPKRSNTFRGICHSSYESDSQSSSDANASSMSSSAPSPMQVRLTRDASLDQPCKRPRRDQWSSDESLATISSFDFQTSSVAVES